MHLKGELIEMIFNLEVENLISFKESGDFGMSLCRKLTKKYIEKKGRRGEKLLN